MKKGTIGWISEEFGKAGWTMQCGPVDESRKKAAVGVGVIHNDTVKVIKENKRTKRLQQAWGAGRVEKYQFTGCITRQSTFHELRKVTNQLEKAEKSMLRLYKSYKSNFPGLRKLPFGVGEVTFTKVTTRTANLFKVAGGFLTFLNVGQLSQFPGSRQPSF